MINWLLDNKEWVFDGAGFVLLSWLAWLFIQLKGRKIWNSKSLTLNESFKLANKLIDHLENTDFLGKGKPDVIVGISAGGLMFADYVSKVFDGQIPIVSMHADIFKHPQTPISGIDNVINRGMIPVLEKYQSFLIVQDIIRTGRTVEDLIKYFKENLPDKNMQVVCLVVNTRAHPKPDYAVVEHSDINTKMPFSKKRSKSSSSRSI